MRLDVLLPRSHGAAAADVVLAELDETRHVLQRSGFVTTGVLIGDGADPDRAELAARLGLPVRRVDASGRSSVESLLLAFGDALANGAEVVVSLDADGQHDARHIPDLVRSHVARQSGLTIGSRWTRGGTSPGTSLTRSALSRGGNAAVKAVTGARGVSDSTTSFRAYHPDLLAVLLDEDLPGQPHGFFSAMVAIAQAHGFAVDEVPIVFRPRYASGPGVGAADLREFAASLAPVRRRVRDVRRSMRSNQAVWAQRNPRLRAQAATTGSAFGAIGELEHLADASRFLEWICDEFEPHLGHRVLDVGAGVGAVACRLAQRGHRVTAIEPAGNVFPDLARRAAGVAGLDVLPITSQQLLHDQPSARFDSVVYVSVLEHILDDVGELRTGHDLLAPGGTLAIFVPAMPSLYGSLDFKSGHYRRYDRELLRRVIEDAGLAVVDVHYLDVAGAVPYFLLYRLLGIPTLDAGSSKAYDSLVVPAGRVAQRWFPRPGFGKNLVAIARRPA